ncbi:MAG: LytR family transcriptional regulator [Lachnospiraceae bacterium]|nr:LytR family transcriptional regulator [Lachnospiraceae bacterium]
MEKNDTNKKIPLWGKILIGVLAFVLLAGGGIYLVIHYYYSQMTYQSVDEEVEKHEEFFDEDENTGNLKEIDPSSIQLDSAAQADKNDDVINILLCGEEAIHDDRGRTDSIMIATINQKDNKLSLTSIMRDTYVKIPGFSDNKINAAYHNGGMKTLVETIKENFGIAVDGYVLVNFDSFEKIIDAVGGVDIELSSEEASYLNRTNYISNPSNRNVSVGMNHMNGNQALGYARVRYVNKDGNVGDFSRTLRHRTVMTAVYKKMMKKSTLELVAMIPDILPLLTTDIKKADLINYLTAGVGVRGKSPKLRTLNVPIEGCYKITRVRTMSVILASPLDANVKKMHKFIYGSTLKDQDELDSGANISVGQ